jgi:hypothetical protein
MQKIAIIGAGASGLIASIAASVAAEVYSNPAEVTIYEASKKPARSILRSGNGRCNFSHMKISGKEYNDPKFVSKTFDELVVIEQSLSGKFFTKSDVKYIANVVETIMCALGVTYIHIDGRTYPSTKKASTISEALLRACEIHGVAIKCGHSVEAIERTDTGKAKAKKYILKFAEGEPVFADRVIVACGGAVQIDGALSYLPHVDFEPVLGPLAVEEAKLCSRMDNVRVDCAVKVLHDSQEVFSEEGEVLFRKYGVSGIVVFNASRFARPGDKIVLDFFPELKPVQLYIWFGDRLRAMLLSSKNNVTYLDFLRGMLPVEVSKAVLDVADVAPDRLFTKEDMGFKNNKPLAHLQRVLDTLKGFELICKDIADASIAQVTRGGIANSALNPKTLEVKNCKGLYITGEALDIDAPCGGYNLHWAFSSGFVAGMCAAQ